MQACHGFSGVEPEDLRGLSPSAFTSLAPEDGSCHRAANHLAMLANRLRLSSVLHPLLTCGEKRRFFDRL